MHPRQTISIRIVSCFLSLAVLYGPGSVVRAAWRDGDSVEDPPAARSAEEREERFWLENMVLHHRFTNEEVARATGLSPTEVPIRLARYGIDRTRRPETTPTRPLRVLPYPGGRHPRIGFLEGAIDPHRDTKFSVFLPWKDAGYVVVDLPEALWSNLGLTYLAHTHIPTIWEEKEIELGRVDWTRKPEGRLESRRRLPNGIRFETRVVPRREWVDMSMRLENGTDAKLTGLRTQICVLLKGAPEFNEQTNDNKTMLDDVVAVRSADRRRWIVTVWDRARPWANPPCPCMHSDPVFPDLAPGEEATVRGRLFFWEGDDLEAEIARRRRAGILRWRADRKPR